MVGIDFRHDKETGDCRMTLRLTDLSNPIQHEFYWAVKQLFHIEVLAGKWDEQKVDGCLVVIINSTSEVFTPLQQAVTKVVFSMENQNN